MRCISPSARFSIQIFEGQEELVRDTRGYASTQVLRKPLIANFEVQGLLEHEILEAMSKFSFSGLAEGVNPLTTVSAFDTEAFCAQFPESERAAKQIQIDQRLRELQETFGGFIIVEPPLAPRPWEKYDEMDADEVIRTVDLLGFKATAQGVRLYEAQNQARPEVIEAMDRIEDPEGAAERYGDSEEETTEVGSTEPREAFTVGS